MNEMDLEGKGQSEGKKEKKLVVLIFSVCIALIIGIKAYTMLAEHSPKGQGDYTVQKEQYYVQYSEQYDYLEVLTVEYPRLEGTEEETQTLINQLLYDTAMDRVNYWHFEPDEEVRKLQEEYTIFSSDVRCDVAYHSQYLLSVDFKEIYAPIDPVYYVYSAERGINLDLMTGEVYELADILRIDEDFIDLWLQAANRKYGEEMPYEEEIRRYLLEWFSGEGGEEGESYDFRPFFHITSEKNFSIGLSVDPKPEGITGSAPKNNVYSVILPWSDVEPYQTESEFWSKYEESETAGRVLECPDRQENLWLGEDAGVWQYWLERGIE